MKSKLPKFLGVFVVPVLFLIVAILTLPHYGFNWDEPFHFYRGQAYLHYFLTGEKNYSSLPSYPVLSKDCPSWAKDCTSSPKGAADIVKSDGKAPITYEKAISKLQKGSTWRSFYQTDLYPLEDLLKTDEGHPPVGGIIAAFTNYILFQKLHIMGDLESHHLAEVLISFLLVLAVSIFVYKKYGLFASIASSIALASYPVFFSESHFNIKDPLLASFYGITVIFFYSGVVNNNWKQILLSALSLGLATGVKFNTFFLPFILGPWLIVFFVIQFWGWYKNKKVKINIIKNLPLFLALVAFPVVAALVFYASWPFLWTDTLAHLDKILTYYRQIGTGAPAEMSSYLIKGWNTYPIKWITYTTPVPVLFFSFFGLIYLFKNILKNGALGLLVILWFSVPILRVSIPNTVVYGGTRQIMEYVPALSILTGVGVFSLLRYLKKRFRKNVRLYNLLFLLVGFSFVWVIYDVARFHPNENVYFNQIIGGLKGAVEKDLPYRGNTYGNVYLQGVKWLNENAEPNAKLGLTLATMGNVPKLKLRADIDFYNGHWSGPNREGEYEMEMYLNWFLNNWYSISYYDKLLKPVYEVKVDGVPLLKIWKNDLEYVYPQYREEKKYFPKGISISGNIIKIDMGKVLPLSRLVINHSVQNCKAESGGYISLSSDGLIWNRETESIDAPQVPVRVTGYDNDTMAFLFPAKEARYVNVIMGVENSCLLENPNIEVRGY